MTENGPPMRIINRAMTEFLIGGVRAAVRPHGGDMVAMVVFTTVQNANLQPFVHAPAEMRRIFRDERALDNDALRPVSINAIAKSFRIPYETARGASERLISQGYCRKVPGGVIAPVDVLARAEFLEVAGGIAAALHTALGRLTDIGFDFLAMASMGEPAPAADLDDSAAPCSRLVSWIAADFVLGACETLVPAFGDFTSAFVFAGAMSANAQAFTQDYELAWLYSQADTPPPDEVRRAVSVRALSELLGVPFETVRRHVNKLIRVGDLERRDDGIMVSMAAMQSERLMRSSPLVAMRFARMITELRRVGFVFDTARQTASQAA